MRVNDLVRFIREREKVRLAKEAGKKRPWTKDPILNKFRFCNVRREDDYVTRWLRDNWYRHLSGDTDLWFAAVVARLFNLPESLYEIMPYVLPWKPEKVRQILHKRKQEGKKNFNAAYIVSTNGVAMDKIDYVVTKVLNPLWANRRLFTEPTGEEFEVLEDWYDLLVKFDGLGSFIAAQVIADLKYIPPWDKAPDWATFAASGPGSRRGMNRILNRDVAAGLSERAFREALEDLRWAVNKKLSEPLHAQDLQNCLCEFDKYERARLGEGTPKQIYKERIDA